MSLRQTASTRQPVLSETVLKEAGNADSDGNPSKLVYVATEDTCVYNSPGQPKHICGWNQHTESWCLTLVTTVMTLNPYSTERKQALACLP